MNYLFGEGYSKVEQNVIKTTPNTVLLYIPSIERAKEIFNIAILCGAKIFDNNHNNVI